MLKEHVRNRLVALLSVVVFLAACTEGRADEPREGRDPAFVPTLAVLADSDPTRLQLQVANKENAAPLQLATIGTRMNCLFIRCLDGREVVHPLDEHKAPRPSIQAIPASASVTWAVVNISRVLSVHDLSKATCDIQWQLDEAVSSPVRISTQPIALSVAVVQNSSPTLLAFTLENRTATPLTVMPPCGPGSPVVLVTKDGEEEVAVAADIDTRLLPKVAAGDTMTWRVTLEHVIELAETKPTKSYEVFWRVSPVGSRQRVTSSSVAFEAVDQGKDEAKNGK